MRKFRTVNKQQKLNCALYVTFFDNKYLESVCRGRLDRTNPSYSSAGNLVINQVRKFVEISVSTQTFFGEFDSGSERTLAAWIRHASRTGLVL